MTAKAYLVVRSAQAAVYSLLGVDQPVAPLYKGQHHLKVDLSALRTLLR